MQIPGHRGIQFFDNLEALFDHLGRGLIPNAIDFNQNSRAAIELGPILGLLESFPDLGHILEKNLLPTGQGYDWYLLILLSSVAAILYPKQYISALGL